VSLATLLTQDVTILTAQTVENRYGRTEKDWSLTPTSSVVKGWVSQTSRSEVTGEREAQVASWVLYLHPDATITGLDRVEWEGITFEVDGPPNPARTPGVLHHYEVPLRVIDG
jgi:hypothetical protein